MYGLVNLTLTEVRKNIAPIFRASSPALFYFPKTWDETNWKGYRPFQISGIQMERWKFLDGTSLTHLIVQGDYFKLRVSTGQPAKLASLAAFSFCSFKLADDASSDLFLLTWKGAEGSLISKFGGWWKCYSCAAKLVGSSHNTCNMGHPVHPILFLLRTSPRNGELSTTSKGGWRKTAHHITSAATKLFLVGRELVFCHHHPASSSICQQSWLTRNMQKDMCNYHDWLSFYCVTWGESLLCRICWCGCKDHAISSVLFCPCDLSFRKWSLYPHTLTYFHQTWTTMALK